MINIFHLRFFKLSLSKFQSILISIIHFELTFIKTVYTVK